MMRDYDELLLKDQQAHAGYYATARQFYARGDWEFARRYQDAGAFTSEEARCRYESDQ